MHSSSMHLSSMHGALIRLADRVPQALVPRSARGCAPGGAASGHLATDDHVAVGPGQAHVQPVLGLLLDVGRVIQAQRLGPQPGQLSRGGLALRLELVDLAALGDVLTHRVGQAQRDRAEDPGQEGGPPDLIWPALTATARSAMVVSSVSPDRCEIMQLNPLRWAMATASSVSVIEPIWFTLTSSEFAARSVMPRRRRSGLVTNRSSPTICTRSPTAAVSVVQPPQSSSDSGSSSDTIG